MNLIDKFISYSRATESLALRTTIEYEKEILYFLNFVSSGPITNELILSLNRSDFYKYLMYCQKKGNAICTRARKISAVKSFYQFLAEEEYLQYNPMSGIRRPQIPKREVDSLSLPESIRLLFSINEKSCDFYKKRNYAIVLLFLTTGMRLSELASIKNSDLIGDKVRVIGKGNKERFIPVGNSALKALYAWLSVRPEDSEYIFTSKKGTGLCVGSIGAMVKTAMRKAGLKEKYSTHTLRHSCASYMYNYGNNDLRSIQLILGHSDVSTTERYTHILSHSVMNAINANPLSCLSI